MRVNFRWLAIALILSSALLGGNAGMAIYTNAPSVKKSYVSSQKTDLEVAVPEKAIIFRNDGKSSLTGSLSNFSDKDVTLSANGYSETVSLAQIKSIEFTGDVLIEGRRLPAKIRMGNKNINELPIKAFQLDKSQKSALISLKTLTNEALERLLKDTVNKRFGVKTIVLDRSDKITIQIVEIE